MKFKTDHNIESSTIIEKKRQWQYLILGLLTMDLVSYCLMESLDLGFSFEDEEFKTQHAFSVIKIILLIAVVVLLTVFLSFCIIHNYNKALMISTIAYLVIGLIIFLYFIISFLTTSSLNARPVAYYDYHINVIALLLSIFCGAMTIAGSVVIFYYMWLQKHEFSWKQAEEIQKICSKKISNTNNPLTAEKALNPISSQVQKIIRTGSVSSEEDYVELYDEESPNNLNIPLNKPFIVQTIDQKSIGD